MAFIQNGHLRNLNDNFKSDETKQYIYLKWDFKINVYTV